MEIWNNFIDYNSGENASNLDLLEVVQHRECPELFVLWVAQHGSSMLALRSLDGLEEILKDQVVAQLVELLQLLGLSSIESVPSLMPQVSHYFHWA